MFFFTCLLCCYFYRCVYLFYLKGRVTQLEEETERQTSHTLVRKSQVCARLFWSQESHVSL